MSKMILSFKPVCIVALKARVRHGAPRQARYHAAATTLADDVNALMAESAHRAQHDAMFHRGANRAKSRRAPALDCLAAGSGIH